MEVREDQLHDETNPIGRFGTITKTSFMTYKKQEKNEITWNNYPDYYNIGTVNYRSAEDIVVTVRKAINLADIISFLGGLVLVIYLGSNLIISLFAHINITALLANRLYSWKNDTNHKKDLGM